MKKIITSSVGALVAFVAVGFFAGSVALAAPVLNQTSITVGLGQSLAVTVQGSTGVYMGYNSNSSVASISTNGTQVTVTGIQLGWATVSLCFVGTSSDCTNLYITVQASSISGLSFDRSNPSASVGQTVNVVVSGGSGYYISGNSNSAVAAPSLASSTLIIPGSSAGTAAITVCSDSNGCGTVNVTVTAGSSSSSTSTSSSTSATSQAVGFSPASPTLAVGRSVTVTLSGGATYFVISNSNGGVSQATVASNVLTITGVSAGSNILTICIAGGDCSALNVTVTAGATTPAYTPTPTPTPTYTPTSTPVPTTQSSADLTALLSAIQSMQGQLAQMASQIQSMATTLSQLASKVTGLQQASTATASASSFTQLLTLGSQGSEVTLLQKKLTTLGFYSGSITGYFGPLTETAVKAYQSARGISPLGSVGPSTRTSLNAE